MSCSVYFPRQHCPGPSFQEEDNRQIHVHVDSHSMGVGGYDSWSPNVLDEYVLHTSRAFSVAVAMVPLSTIATIE